MFTSGNIHTLSHIAHTSLHMNKSCTWSRDVLSHSCFRFDSLDAPRSQTLEHHYTLHTYIYEYNTIMLCRQTSNLMQIISILPIRNYVHTSLLHWIQHKLYSLQSAFQIKQYFMIRFNFNVNTPFSIHTVSVGQIIKNYWNDLQFASFINSGHPSWGSTCTTTIHTLHPKNPQLVLKT
jgi:hypothetical protein